jgi:acyl-CoA synthetase (AMP-forming)/AMP-acid ligase II
MFIDPGAGRRHIERCCGAVRPDAFIGVVRAHALRLTSRELRRIPRSFSLTTPLPFAQTLRARRRVTSSPITRVDNAAPALITFTSGSTGEPKALVRTHGFLAAQHRVLASELALTERQRDLSTLPMFVLANLASGVTSIIASGCGRPSRVRPAELARQLAEARPTRVAASPAFVAKMLDGERHSAGLLGGLTRIDIGGAPVFPHLLRAVSAAVPHAIVGTVYGSTEAEPIARLRWADATYADCEAMTGGAGLLAGHPVSDVRVRIVQDRWGTPVTIDSEADLDRVSLPPGCTGEIVVSGPHVAERYLDGSIDSLTKFAVAGRIWHRTGDAGSLDARGRLWLAGRCSSKAVDDRGTLYPLGVECAAQEIAGVRRSALLAYEGQRVLVVEPAERSRPEDIRRIARRTLSWADLDRIVFTSAIPLDARHHAKTDYPALRATLGRT